MRFTRYGNKLANSEEAKKDYKKRLDIKKRLKEVSDIELQMWYEDSVFRRVSGIEYSRNIALAKYELFLEKDDKYLTDIPGKKTVHINKQKEIPAKNDDDDYGINNEPLFKIKFKK
ncbi:MAG: hypothetical protein PHX78_00025 [bacterium]|nr:hypothetical protein [bacterium]